MGTVPFEIHRLHVHGEDHIANMSDPQIPAALAPAIAGIAWLNDFRPKPQYTGPTPGTCQPYDKNNNWAQDWTCYWVVPADLWTIYNFPTSSYDGTGQTVAVMEDVDPLFGNSDWCDFRNVFFGETTCKTGLFKVVHPNSCNDPGSNPPAPEVVIDPQWASAAAPGALIKVAACPGNGTTPGYLIALENYVDKYSGQIISMSYGFCEASLGLGGMSLLNTTYQQAAAEGFSVFVAAGDAGAALCDWGNDYAMQGIAVSGYASSPYVVAVGGTTFADWALGNPIPSPYWSSQNGQYWGSAPSYIPEIPWNSSCGNRLLALSFIVFSRRTDRVSSAIRDFRTVWIRLTSSWPVVAVRAPAQFPPMGLPVARDIPSQAGRAGSWAIRAMGSGMYPTFQSLLAEASGGTRWCTATST